METSILCYSSLTIKMTVEKCRKEFKCSSVDKSGW